MIAFHEQRLFLFRGRRLPVEQQVLARCVGNDEGALPAKPPRKLDDALARERCIGSTNALKGDLENGHVRMTLDDSQQLSEYRSALIVAPSFTFLTDEIR